MADAFLDDLGGVVDTAFSPAPVLPGDDLTSIVTRVATGLELGDGLLQQGDQVLAVRAGVLRYRPPNKYWVEQNQRKYTPASEHFVRSSMPSPCGQPHFPLFTVFLSVHSRPSSI